MGVPSPQTALGLMWYVMVCGLVVSFTLVTSCVLRTGLRAELTM
jgi:hypothetical protein